jgi:protein gp37
MATRTGIEWTEVTWNPTTGCDQISAGCDNCYALTLARRLKAMGSAKYQHDGDPRTSGPGFGLAIHPHALRQPYTWGGPRVVFVNSMSDLFHARVPLSFVAEVFAVIADTPQHTYQVLTKRSSRLRKIAARLDWPTNLWMGVSVEDSGALYRVDDLRSVPAAVRRIDCTTERARISFDLRERSERSASTEDPCKGMGFGTSRSWTLRGSGGWCPGRVRCRAGSSRMRSRRRWSRCSSTLRSSRPGT